MNLAARLDAVLERDVRDRLANDRRLAHVDVDVRVDGAVAHVHGCVGDRDEVRLVRRVVAGVNGIRGVWDLLRVAGRCPTVVDLGCGGNKQVAWAVGVDAVVKRGVDVAADLDRGLPFATGSVDHVFAIHVLEHVTGLVPLVTEIHRVLAPGGVLHVLAPNWRHPNAVADPTHVRYFAKQTLMEFCRNRGTMPCFRPVVAAASDDTVYADLEVIPDGSPAADDELARWFA